ncbi:MAG: response regulator [Vicinamibacterales bacterium]|nr:response regulator [Vicinamibacterales bacterium]
MAHKLLLADDSVTIQRVIELTFSGEDIDVLAVSDGEQAIARIPLERPDIVLADIGMPKRSGYDVAAFVKGDPTLKHIPVLLLAGAFEPVDDALAAQVGCDGVLVKPFEPQHVIARVRELLEGKKGAPARGTVDVARPVERLALRAEDQTPPRVEAAPVARVEAPTPTPAPAPRVIEERILPKPIEFPRREDAPPPPPVIDRDSVDAFDFAEAATASGETAGPRSQGADESLDEYFDRLDAAFATLSGVSMPSHDRPGDEASFDDRLDVPTLDHLLASDYGTLPSSAIDLPLHTPTVTPFTPKPFVAPPSVEPPDVTPTRAPGPAERPPQAERHTPAPSATSDRIVADAFTALLAVEQGEPGAAPVRLTAAPAEPVITDAFLDEVVRRVVERLSPGAARDVITDIVSEVAERLVREEIERIRKRQ